MHQIGETHSDTMRTFMSNYVMVYIAFVEDSPCKMSGEISHVQNYNTHCPVLRSLAIRYYTPG